MSPITGAWQVSNADSLRDAWPELPAEQRVEGFLMLRREEAAQFFLSRAPLGQAQILTGLPEGQRRIWIRILAPDDAADLLQRVDPDMRAELLGLLDDATRHEVNALLAYAEDNAGGLMNPRFARIRPDMRVDEAIPYLQRQARSSQLETIYYVYVLNAEQRLLGVCSFRQLLTALPEKTVHDIMRADPVVAHEDTDQEALARLFQQHSLMALPVVDSAGHMKGIVTIDDIVDVVQEEATEDAQKFGGMQALDAPYLQTSFWNLVRKRAGWLAVLFLGEMLTASAMGHFESEIARAVILVIFIPLIISSGGNAGSQASTLIVRAMALGEVKLRNWWQIMRRELLSGVALGVVLGTIGVVRILSWQAAFHLYGKHYLLVAMTVGVSLIGVVTWGTFAGSMLPFMLRRCRLDPASASAPFVATLVDVSGLIIYFEVAQLLLHGTLL